MQLRTANWFLCSATVATACSSDLHEASVDEQREAGSVVDNGASRADGLPSASEPLPGDGGEPDAPVNVTVAGDAGVNATLDAATAPTYVHYDINHVLSTGASDSVANGASAFITTAQPFGNLSFNTGVMTASGCNASGCTGYQTPTAFAPLVEGDKFFNYGVETMSSGLANQANVFASAYFASVGLPAVEHALLVSLHGRSGNAYWCLRLQTTNVQPGYGPCYLPKSAGYIAPFDEALMQVQSAKVLAAAAGKTYAVRAVTAIHGQGESDSSEQNFTFLVSTDGANTPLTNYADALLDWQWDYDTKVRAITGQAQAIPMFVSQFGSMKTPMSMIPQRQLDAHVRSNGKVNLVSPNYPFTHYVDCLHYTPHSQRRLGAYFAKAYEKVVVEGKKWEPTRPLSIKRAGAMITVTYAVPVPPLVIDTVRVDASNTNFKVAPFYGFIYRDSSMSASIINVAVTAPDTLTITLSAAPTGASRILRYAFEAQSTNACPGPTNGARGNIRDSDAALAYHTDANGKPYELFNWSVAYQLDVP